MYLHTVDMHIIVIGKLYILYSCPHTRVSHLSPLSGIRGFIVGLTIKLSSDPTVMEVRVYASGQVCVYVHICCPCST